jgi:hypothetical protein
VLIRPEAPPRLTTRALRRHPCPDADLRREFSPDRIGLLILIGLAVVLFPARWPERLRFTLDRTGTCR